MAAEYSNNSLQRVEPGQAVVFTESPVPCTKGYIFHRDESGIFYLSSRNQKQYCCGGNVRTPEAVYEVGFHANIQIPADGTVETISLAISIGGEIDPSSTMSVTPAATEEPFNVGAGVIVAVPAICGCTSVSVRNIGTEPIEVLNANIISDTAGVRR